MIRIKSDVEKPVGREQFPLMQLHTEIPAFLRYVMETSFVLGFLARNTCLRIRKPLAEVTRRIFCVPHLALAS